jgi:hypothetical protein
MSTKVKPAAKPAVLKVGLSSISPGSDAHVAPRNIERTPGTLPKPIQIRVPVEKHSEIKAYAAEQQISITDLLIAAYEEYRARHR